MWHIQDIDNLYMENEIKMPLNSFRAVAHLGGKTGALKYAKTRDLPFGHPDKYNPHDGGKKSLLLLNLRTLLMRTHLKLIMLMKLLCIT